MSKNEEKTLCAVKNPEIRKNQYWFYNNFLGRDRRNKVARNEVKINWLMTLTNEEIKILKEKSCNVIKLADNIEFDTDDEIITNEIKKGFNALFNLFEKSMEDELIQKKLKDLLSNGDGAPNEDYLTIINTKKLLG